MFDFIIRQACLSDGQLTDIAVQDGKIAEVGNISGRAVREYPLGGRFRLSAGWIDSHVHCYPSSPVYHDEPDKVGIEGGVTTVIDAGSTGADDIADFYQLTRSAHTNVYALLNIARCGIARQDELSRLSMIDRAAVKQAVRQFPEFIKGLKARMSHSVVGENGITPLLIARQMQQDNDHLPLMVHVGNSPPDLCEIADLLQQGDILTHCYNGKPNQILTPGGELKVQVQQALQRGVRLDSGHGTASFNFTVAQTAIAQGILPDTISSDIYCRNRLHGPVHSLAHVMSKFLNLGMTLPQVIDCVTNHPARLLQLEGKGQLTVGSAADLTIFNIQTCSGPFMDSEGQTFQGKHQIVPLAAVTGGRWFITDEGRKHHVFGL